ncbi:MAG: DUF92 domain-containing protein [Candidatus Marinimicrobia bacterium]|nr:DUF92 domain-containing protein [Candidatus Neomarinimicrobiota bacterium]MCF7850947.1 DUF92 domain-containing protein [Candidatus Neomarinimicrobiota bacterium]
MPLIFDFSSEWIAFFVYFAIIMGFIGISELARKVLKLSPELSRKFVHVMVGILVGFAPFFLSDSLPAIALGILFTVLNYVALKQDSFKGMHTTERVSFGTVYFPIAFTILIVLFWERNIVIFILAMLILAFSDTLATVVGEAAKPKKMFTLWRDPKSWPGSSTFFITTFIIIILGQPCLAELAGQTPLPFIHLLGMALFTSVLTSIGEAVSKRGSDNLTLTLVAAISLDLYLYNLANGTLHILFAWFFFSIIMGWGAYKAKALSVSGGFGAFLLGVFMFGSGGWNTMLPLIGFFVLSSLLSKIADRKSRTDVIVSKGSRRDIVQVYANGGIALIIALGWYFTGFKTDWLYWAFLASIAAATSDTWETEIGSFSKGLPIDILTGKRVAKGYSGGVSLLGSFGGLLGAFLITITALMADAMNFDPLLITLIFISGFLGSVIDSVLGSSIQAKYICTVCEKPTEKLIHCDKPTSHVSGLVWLDNDWVNVAATLSGALIFTLLYFILQP